MGSYGGIPNYDLAVTFSMDDGSQISMTIQGVTHQSFKDTLDRYRWIHFDDVSVNLGHVRHVTVKKVTAKKGTANG